MTTPIQPSGLFKVLRKVLPENSSITMDAGTLCLQATDALNYFEPRSLFTPLDFGLVGFSFACGLGVKLAQPDRKVISLMDYEIKPLQEQQLHLVLIPTLIL